MAGARKRPQEGPEEEELESVGEQHCRRGGGEAVRWWARGKESRELQRVFIRYSRASAGRHRKNSRVRMRCWSFDRESGRKNRVRTPAGKWQSNYKTVDYSSARPIRAQCLREITFSPGRRVVS